MAKFYQKDGIIGFRHNDAEEAQFPLPIGAVNVVEFDEFVPANAVVIADFDRGYSRFSYVNGQLRRDGIAVSFAPDSQTKQDLDGLLAAASQAVDSNTAFLGIASPTNAQTLAQVRALTQQNNRIIKRLVILGRK